MNLVSRKEGDEQYKIISNKRELFSVGNEVKGKNITQNILVEYVSFSIRLILLETTGSLIRT
jgi:hypothetical protein